MFSPTGVICRPRPFVMHSIRPVSRFQRRRAVVTAVKEFLVWRVSPVTRNHVLFQDYAGMDSTMNVDDIVECIRQDTALFASAWNDEFLRFGRGAMVILPPQPSVASSGAQLEFWTVDEIRATLRMLRSEDEFAFRWIHQCEEEGGLPVMVLSPDLSAPGSYELCFHRFMATSES